MYNNQFMIDNLTRQRDKFDEMIKSYQTMPQAPVNNIINGVIQPQDNLYEIKKLNENDEVENIAIFRDSIFIGDDRMQIKKLDGSIEKYEIKKIYPRDKKDDKIDELTKKIKEMEEKLNEHTIISEPIKDVNKSYANDDGFIKSTTKATSRTNEKP